MSIAVLSRQRSALPAGAWPRLPAAVLAFALSSVFLALFADALIAERAFYDAWGLKTAQRIDGPLTPEPPSENSIVGRADVQLRQNQIQRVEFTIAAPTRNQNRGQQPQRGATGGEPKIGPTANKPSEPRAS